MLLFIGAVLRSARLALTSYGGVGPEFGRTSNAGSFSSTRKRAAAAPQSWDYILSSGLMAGGRTSAEINTAGSFELFFHQCCELPNSPVTSPALSTSGCPRAYARACRLKPNAMLSLMCSKGRGRFARHRSCSVCSPKKPRRCAAVRIPRRHWDFLSFDGLQRLVHERQLWKCAQQVLRPWGWCLCVEMERILRHSVDAETVARFMKSEG